MTPHGTKTMELAEKYAESLYKFNSGGGELKPNRQTMREVLRQHIEAGEKDCRTCKGFTLCLGITARHEPQACVNFSLYQEANADFKQLTQGAR